MLSISPKEAGEHADEILRDWQCATNLGEFLVFCRKTAVMYDNDAKLWNEINELEQYFGSVCNFNMAVSGGLHKTVEKTAQNESMAYEVYMLEKGAMLANVCAGSESLYMLNAAEGMLNFMEMDAKGTKIAWEGVPDKQQLDKAKELAPLATLAEELATADGDKLLEIERAKNIDEGGDGDAYIKVYTALVKHPGFVKLCAKGAVPVSADTLGPGMTANALEKIKNQGNLSPDESGALELWIELCGKWDSVKREAA